MSHHRRREIRNAVIATLLGLPTTGTSVYSGRVYPTGASQLPVLLVYTQEEEAQALEVGINSRTEKRTLTLAVEAVTAGANSEALLDEISLEVEAALANNKTLNGYAIDTNLRVTRFRRNATEQEFQTAVLEYEIQYYIHDTNPV